MIFKIKKHLKNKFSEYLKKNPGIYRPSSHPFLTGDTLRNYSDHIFDETKTLNPKLVKNNDVVFLKTELKDIYFKNYHKEIDSNYILLTHNSDIPINDEDTKFIDENIIHWFAMKLNVNMNDKISPIPSGLENRYLRRNGKVDNFNKVYSSYLLNPDIKKDKILSSFNVLSNYEIRSKLLQQVKDDDKVNIKNFQSSLEYLNELSNYSFNLCPEGNNYESHRIWESLIFDCTPIVLSNHVNNNFFSLGVPMIMLEKWDDLNHLSINDLIEMNNINNDKNYLEFATFEFWKKLIEAKKTN